MNTCHIYLFTDSCPTDWLINGMEESWHTIAYFVFQSDPKEIQHLQLNKQENFNLAIERDSQFHRLLAAFKHPHNKQFMLKKWNSGDVYRKKFLSALNQIDPQFYPQFNALSFQEKTLKLYEPQLMVKFNQIFSGKPIGFEKLCDTKGRPIMRHSYVDILTGYHVIERPVNQMLVLLLMATIIGDQFIFYRNKVLANREWGFDKFKMTVVSDRLSGDNDIKQYAENTLKFLLTTSNEEIVLTKSPISDHYAGDLVVDNLAGLLNECISDVKGKTMQKLSALASLAFLRGWNKLENQQGIFDFVPVLELEMAK